jgi:hypothetical protein
MPDLVIGVSVRAWSKSANSIATLYLDGHPAYTATTRGISTTSSDTNEKLSGRSLTLGADRGFDAAGVAAGLRQTRVTQSAKDL